MRLLLSLALGLSFAVPAAADETYAAGDLARSVGLGGGGVALSGPAVGSRVNPAALAGSRGVRADGPLILLGLHGGRAHAVLDNLIRNGDFDHLLDVGYSLLLDETRVWTRLEQSVRVDHWEIGLGGGGQVLGIPNRSATRWAQDGAFGLPPPDARFVAEFGYTMGVPVAYGHRFRVRGPAGGTVDVGLRLFPQFGRYERDRYQADRGRNRAVRIRETRVQGLAGSADLGVIYGPTALPDVTFGMVARGFLATPLGRLSPTRTVDVGAAVGLSPRLLAVADWTNLAGAGPTPPSLSAGVEYTVIRPWLAVRGGVSRYGLSAGFSVGPLSFAYTPEGETMLRTGMSF